MRKDVLEIVQTLKKLARQGSELRLDSRTVQPGDIFVAVPGAHVDGRHFIPVAVARGAAAVVLETPETPLPAAGVPVIMVKDLLQHLGEIASGFNDEPTRDLRGVAVTGTNGKTTTTHWVSSLLSRLGEPCAVLGTVGAKLGDESFESPELTTPDAISVQRLFRAVKKAGARAFAVEASSVGLDQGRLKGSDFKVAVFTNLTRDHLDYHKTMENYEAAKAILFAWPGLTGAVVNIDDPAAATMIRVAREHNVPVWTTTLTGARVEADHRLEARDISLTADGIHFTLLIDGEAHRLQLPQVGDFNVSNAMEAIAAVMVLGYSAREVLPLVSTLPSPPGRMQLFRAENSPLVLVDYSHTPDALEKALSSLAPVARARNGRLWAVFGCGGDRDKGKRPLMGAIAARLADETIVTSDNPRSEDPVAIIRDITAGMRTEPDRKAAIFEAVLEASPEDVILVAGKGHETYQIIQGVHHFFSDQEVVKAAFNERRTRTLK